MPRTGIRPVCHCGELVNSKGRGPTGIQMWFRECWKCRNGGYRLHKKDHCAECGFVAIHSVQLDVDHIDGNHLNNDVLNLQTLCANCHRLKTQVNKDHLPNRGATYRVDTGQMELSLDA